MLIRQFFIAFLSCVFPLACLAQDAGNDEDVRHQIFSPYRLDIRGNGLVPLPIADEAFKKTFQGIYDATFSLNLDFYKGWNIGLMYKNSGFQTTILNLNTKLQYNVGGGRIGYDYFISKVFVFSPAINVGKCYITSSDIVPLASTMVQGNSQGLYMEPELSISFFTEDNFAIGFNLSYEVIAIQFNPYYLALDQHGIGFSNRDLEGLTQNLSIGFHFVYSFLPKKKKR